MTQSGADMDAVALEGASGIREGYIDAKGRHLSYRQQLASKRGYMKKIRQIHGGELTLIGKGDEKRSDAGDSVSGVCTHTHGGAYRCILREI